ncbi:hypothetical protein GCM10009716_27410 [Streptomyces sodiiphilus]|uniref:Glycosyl hydrolase family 32 C-terminal domain-containing protein n=1 Tax=Streptomyces sodiiphilus TaxID=226217 RepID=A0ABP5AMS6_9ACTN
MRQSPARELAGLRTGEPRGGELRVSPGEDTGIASLPAAAELELRVDFGRDAAWSLRLTAPGGGEHLGLLLSDGVLTVDRDHASRDPRARGGSYRMPLPGCRPHGTAGLRLVLDHSVLELFTDEGEALTLRCYPTGGSGWTLRSRGAAADDVRVGWRAYELCVPEEG